MTAFGTIATPDGTGWVPPGRMPSHGAVSYWRELLLLALLLLALPWLVHTLVTQPSRVLAGRGPGGAG